MIWIATANRIDWIGPVLRSRFEFVEVPALGRAELKQFIDVAIPVDDRDAMRRILADIPVGPCLTLRHVRRLADRLVGAERAEPLQ